MPLDCFGGIVTNKNSEPKADIATCSECGWSGSPLECEKEEEGDWDTGYYSVDICPRCPDGGCIDDYGMSEERAAEWEAWHNQKMQSTANSRRA